MSSGNYLSLIVINKTKLEFKISHRILISQLFVLDTICVVFSILMFSIHVRTRRRAYMDLEIGRFNRSED